MPNEIRGEGADKVNSLEEKLAEIINGVALDVLAGREQESVAYFKAIIALISESQKDTHIALDEVRMVRCPESYISCTLRKYLGYCSTGSRAAYCNEGKIPSTVRDILEREKR